MLSVSGIFLPHSTTLRNYIDIVEITRNRHIDSAPVFDCLFEVVLPYYQWEKLSITL